jgi:hypothetical protein
VPFQSNPVRAYILSYSLPNSVVYLSSRRDGEFKDVDWKWQDAEGLCYGHNSYDSLPFSRLFGETDEDSQHYYSNADLMQHMHPKNPKVPYVYDTFSWPHCKEERGKVDPEAHHRGGSSPPPPVPPSPLPTEAEAQL